MVSAATANALTTCVAASHTPLTDYESQDHMRQHNARTN
jgi:hypothetical protein